MEEIKKERQEKKAKAKPLSKYANRKGAAHKGRNDRSRRAKVRNKSNATKRSHMGKH